MRQAPFGILHFSIYSSQASGRARAPGTPDTTDTAYMQAGKGSPSVVHASGPVL